MVTDISCADIEHRAQDRQLPLGGGENIGIELRCRSSCASPLLGITLPIAGMLVCSLLSHLQILESHELPISIYIYSPVSESTANRFTCEPRRGMYVTSHKIHAAPYVAQCATHGPSTARDTASDTIRDTVRGTARTPYVTYDTPPPLELELDMAAYYRRPHKTRAASCKL